MRRGAADPPAEAGYSPAEGVVVGEDVVVVVDGGVDADVVGVGVGATGTFAETLSSLNGWLEPLTA